MFCKDSHSLQQLLAADKPDKVTPFQLFMKVVQNKTQTGNATVTVHGVQPSPLIMSKVTLCERETSANCDYCHPMA